MLHREPNAARPPDVITAAVPGWGALHLRHAVFDFNGTLACDGALLSGVASALTALADDVEVHVLTADTIGRAAAELDGLPLRLTVIGADDQTAAKRSYVESLGAETVVVFGNGRNDAQMLAVAHLGVALIQVEGCAAATLAAADVVCTSVLDAIALVRSPGRLTATLRC